MGRPGATVVTLGATIGLLAAGNVVRSTVVPSSVDLALNAAMAGGVLAITAAGGVGAAELGLARRELGRGLRWGGAAYATVTVVAIGAALVPAAAGLFDDERAEVGAGELLWDVAVRIPVGTVLLEELAFRGSILALLVRMVSTPRAVVASSVLFGAWHVAPAWTSSGGDALIVVGTVVATTLAGIVFCWLRRGSGSLVAPILAHLATNTVPLVTAWVLAR